MLWKHRFAPLIADGSVTVTFRRWRRRQALAGWRYRTLGGIIEVDDIRKINPAKISERDARHSGHRSSAAVNAAQPARRAPDLAASFGRDTAPFKIDVRKLKNLGLTISAWVSDRRARSPRELRCRADGA